MLTQSAHPLALFFLYFFRIAAITVYILCGWFTSDYVLSVWLLYICHFAQHLLTCLVDGSRRSSSRHGFLELPGNNTYFLRQCLVSFSNIGFAERIRKNTCWTSVLEPGSFILFSSVVSFVKTSLQVDEDGESYWVFESRDVRMPFILTLPLSIVISLLGRQTLWIQGMFFQQFAFHL